MLRKCHILVIYLTDVTRFISTYHNTNKILRTVSKKEVDMLA